jgi:hypothetical protein
MLNNKNKTNMWEYPAYIGKLVINLHSLENAIRTCLLTNDVGHKKGMETTIGYHNLVIGQEVDKDAFTNYDQLGELIDKYNKMVTSYSWNDLKISDELVDLRHAMAHGRAFYKEIHDPFTTMILLKFSPPNNRNKLKVVYMKVMTNNWLEQKIDWVFNEHKKVVEAHNKIKKIKP